MNNKPYTFVFFGIAGSGKGTQVELLKKYLTDKGVSEIAYCYPGGEFRKVIEANKLTGQLVKSTLDLGHLQPNFVTTTFFSSMVINAMDTNPNSCIIADGYPRTISQAVSFEEMVNFYSREDIKIIYIELSKEEATKRMKLRARSDDTDEGIAKRFDEYVNNVIPAMNYFKDKAGYTLYTINGEQTIEEVHQELINKLGL